MWHLLKETDMNRSIAEHLSKLIVLGRKKNSFGARQTWIQTHLSLISFLPLQEILNYCIYGPKMFISRAHGGLSEIIG